MYPSLGGCARRYSGTGTTACLVVRNRTATGRFAPGAVGRRGYRARARPASTSGRVPSRPE
jgi:hypothetical protein